MHARHQAISLALMKNFGSMTPLPPPRTFRRKSTRQRAGSAESRTLVDLDLTRQRCGLLRLFVFIPAAAIAWFAIQGQLPLWPIAIPLALFIALIWWQSRIERDMEFARRAASFYERGLARIQHRWQGGGETGERFIDPHHPYSVDLDIFGRASLFELLSTAPHAGRRS